MRLRILSGGDYRGTRGALPASRASREEDRSVIDQTLEQRLDRRLNTPTLAGPSIHRGPLLGAGCVPTGGTMPFTWHAMSGEAWTIIGVGVAILGLGAFFYRELRTDIRGLQADVSKLRDREDVPKLRERIARLEARVDGPSIREMLQSGGDDNAGA